MNPDELTGLTVMVHPLLWDDPAGRTGQIGVITEADRGQYDYLVRFDDKMRAHYSAGALQVLQPPEKLYELMENRATTLSPGVLNDLHTLVLLQRYGSARQFRTAFELVQQHEHLQPLATLSLEEALGEYRGCRVGR
ncbi:hypothetical protein HH214_08650 [Mucilaginibacter robiniae]|uniref:Uncharacterized protein n=1 Tax=Mucilaginibacter robiniae TaxID=2728022 RepID=A0A7L5E0C1_9SPHI|nr:hypothetical protein [Mucilaginibacter robiniae]QJD95938.1 hypothetical protein HH214_08650 [Mucilaginibacter robiniae]